MAILSIVRDYGTNPSIVRMTTNDSYATMTAAGYLASQMADFNAINGGAFQFNASDMILCYYPGGFQFFILNSTLTAFIPYADSLPVPVASSVLVTDQNANPAWDGPLTNGQIIIGSTGAQPVAATLTAGSNVTITNSAGGITIASTAGGGGVNAGTANQLTYYATTGSQVSGLTGANNGVLITSNAGIPSWLANGTAGQVLTANTGAPPSWQAGGGSGLTIATIAGTTQTAAVNTKYYALNAGQTTVTLPATYAVGNVIALIGSTANVGGWVIQAAGGDTIRYLNNTSTAGGTLTSSASAGTTAYLECDVANTSWVVSSTVNVTLTTA